MSRSTKSEPAVWLQQPCETTAAWTAFIRYRDLGPGRSLGRLAAELGRATVPSHWWGWRRTGDWDARSGAWDEMLKSKRKEVGLADAQKWQERRRQSLKSTRDLAKTIVELLDGMLASSGDS